MCNSFKRLLYSETNGIKHEIELWLFIMSCERNMIFTSSPAAFSQVLRLFALKEKIEGIIMTIVIIIVMGGIVSIKEWPRFC